MTNTRKLFEHKQTCTQCASGNLCAYGQDLDSKIPDMLPKPEGMSSEEYTKRLEEILYYARSSNRDEQRRSRELIRDLTGWTEEEHEYWLKTRKIPRK
jgi:hypothetical protein